MRVPDLAQRLQRGRKQLLVGSAREGAVFRVAADGSLSKLAGADDTNGMWAVFDIAVDAKRGVLWVASTAVPHFQHYDAQQDLGRAGVFKFDLKTGKFLKSFLSPSIVGQTFTNATKNQHAAITIPGPI